MVLQGNGNIEVNGSISDNPGGATPLSSSANGTGTRTLMVANAHTGQTNVNGGKLVIKVPDIQAACKLAAEQGVEAIAYQSAIGPIRVLDMLYGYQQMVLQSEYMAHKMGFDHPKLGRAVVGAGFAKATVMVMNEYELVCEAVK